MQDIGNAISLLKKGQRAIVLFTRGGMLEIGQKGCSGNWAIAKDNFSRVIIYNRSPANRRGAEIYIGRFTGFGDPIQPEQNQKLRSVHFEKVFKKGRTNGTFWDFTGKHARRICYVEGV